MDTQSISNDVQETILNNYRDTRDTQHLIPFCVDGRDGPVEYADNHVSADHLFVQSLGGALGIATIRFMARGAEGSFSETLSDTLTELTAQGLNIGVHRDSHAHDDVSGCGYADNLSNILQRLSSHADDIKTMIEAAAPGALQESVWVKVIDDATKAADVDKHTSGEELVAESVVQGAHLQTLNGNHEEVAAVVNLAAHSTLDTKSLVSQDLQAFNLDVWYVHEQAKALSLDAAYVTHAILGLYVATEMVLVEDKKNVRLPIIVRS